MMLNSMSPANRKLLLRVGAVLAILAAIFTFVAGNYHPSKADPSDHLAAFAEYSASEIWVTDHVVQTYGFFFMFTGLIALGYVLAEREGPAQVLTRLGLPVAIAAVAAAAVLQGLDTVTLKAMIDKWATASEASKAAAFADAETVRHLEIGFNSTFRMLQGFSILLFGAALGFEKGWVRWLGWIGVLLGMGFIVRGFAVTYTGFSPSNPMYWIVGGYAAKLLAPWLVALAVFMGLESRR